MSVPHDRDGASDGRLLELKLPEFVPLLNRVNTSPLSSVSDPAAIWTASVPPNTNTQLVVPASALAVLVPPSDLTRNVCVPLPRVTGTKALMVAMPPELPMLKLLIVRMLVPVALPRVPNPVTVPTVALEVQSREPSPLARQTVRPDMSLDPELSLMLVLSVFVIVVPGEIVVPLPRTKRLIFETAMLPARLTATKLNCLGVTALVDAVLVV